MDSGEDTPWLRKRKRTSSPRQETSSGCVGEDTVGNADDRSDLSKEERGRDETTIEHSNRTVHVNKSGFRYTSPICTVDLCKRRHPGGEAECWVAHPELKRLKRQRHDVKTSADENAAEESALVRCHDRANKVNSLEVPTDVSLLQGSHTEPSNKIYRSIEQNKDDLVGFDSKEKIVNSDEEQDADDESEEDELSDDYNDEDSDGEDDPPQDIQSGPVLAAALPQTRLSSATIRVQDAVSTVSTTKTTTKTAISQKKPPSNWPSILDSDQFKGASVRTQREHIDLYMQEMSNYADMIQAVAVPIGFVSRFFRRVDKHLRTLDREFYKISSVKDVQAQQDDLFRQFGDLLYKAIQTQAAAEVAIQGLDLPWVEAASCPL